MKTTSKYYDYCAGENRMVDTPAIMKAMKQLQYNMHTLAEEIGISYHTIRNRFKYGNWTVLEAYRLCGILSLDFMSVFFAYPEEVGA